MKNFLAGCVAVGVIVTAQCAAAADLSVAPLYKAPPSEVSQAYNWTGFYLGINGGGGWGDSHWQGVGHFGLPGGGQVGGTAGYNWQIGQAVVGLEGDMDYSHLQGTTTSPACPAGTCTTGDSWLA